MTTRDQLHCLNVLKGVYVHCFSFSFKLVYRFPAIYLILHLYQDEGAEMPFLPLTAAPPLKHYIVPTGIRPNLQNTRVEVRMYVHVLEKNCIVSKAL